MGPYRRLWFTLIGVLIVTWYARSEAFMQQDLLQTLRWVRTLGDVVFIGGAVAMSLQVVLGLIDRTPALQPPPLAATDGRAALGKATT